MEIERSELDTLIEQLNSHQTVHGKSALTEKEMHIIEMYQPERVLIVYGTLAPNRPNHSVVEHIKGTWHKGKVIGKLVSKGWGAQSGYNGFVHVTQEQHNEIDVHILFSDELINQWQYLDNFEGSDYRRILTKYELDNGDVGVGNIYAIQENNH
jgi:gamma-glutamylcyclotransferase (GGCT)/AIG2-like uncharacterized protein YtfP